MKHWLLLGSLPRRLLRQNAPRVWDCGAPSNDTLQPFHTFKELSSALWRLFIVCECAQTLSEIVSWSYLNRCSLKSCCPNEWNKVSFIQKLVIEVLRGSLPGSVQQEGSVTQADVHGCFQLERQRWKQFLLYRWTVLGVKVYLYWCVGRKYLKYLTAYHSFLKFDMWTGFQL